MHDNIDLDDQITTFLNPYNGGFAAFKNSTKCVSPPPVLILDASIPNILLASVLIILSN